MMSFWRCALSNLTTKRNNMMPYLNTVFILKRLIWFIVCVCVLVTFVKVKYLQIDLHIFTVNVLIPFSFSAPQPPTINEFVISI